jgi:outer membrane protein assembly factor BamE (lipoprotein component of BamABCDE complex)
MAAAGGATAADGPTVEEIAAVATSTHSHDPAPSGAAPLDRATPSMALRSRRGAAGRAGAIARGLAAVCAALLLGCNTEPMDPHYYNEGNPYQRYSYDEVKQRLRSVKPGMPRYEVLVRLGSPAENRGDTWLYLPEQPRFLIPGDFLEVKFDGDLYVSHRFRPIVLGEKVTDP